MEHSQVFEQLRNCMNAHERAQLDNQPKRAEYALGDAVELLFDQNMLPFVFDEASLRWLYRQLSASSDLVSPNYISQAAEQSRTAQAIHDLLFSLVDRGQTPADSARLACKACGLDVDVAKQLASSQLDSLQRIRTQESSDLAKCAKSFILELAQSIPTHAQLLHLLVDQVSHVVASTNMEKGAVHGLFVGNGSGHVRSLRVLGIKPAQGLQVIRLQRSGVDEHGSAWDQKACYAALTLAWKDAHYEITYDLEKENTVMEGGSNGLALAVAILEKAGFLPRLDSYTAFTGELDADGSVLPIDGLEQKLAAAVEHGIRRVFVPMGNKNANGLLMPKIVGVSSLSHLCDIMRADWTSSPSGIQSDFERTKLLLYELFQNKNYQVQDAVHMRLLLGSRP